MKHKPVSGFEMAVDAAARRIKSEKHNKPQRIIYEVSRRYGVDIHLLAAELGKRKGRPERVKCSVEYVTIQDDDGVEKDCVVATCSRCGLSILSLGTGNASVKRCLAAMRENCKLEEVNYYFWEGG